MAEILALIHPLEGFAMANSPLISLVFIKFIFIFLSTFFLFFQIKWWLSQCFKYTHWEWILLQK
jgi:hypothetical protein